MLLCSELPAAGPSQPVAPKERAADPEGNPPEEVVTEPTADAPKRKVADPVASAPKKKTADLTAKILKIQEDKVDAPLVSETSRRRVSTLVFLPSVWSTY